MELLARLPSFTINFMKHLFSEFFEKKFPSLKYLWGEAILTTTYLINTVLEFQNSYIGISKLFFPK